jgi:hypothetical protein
MPYVPRRLASPDGSSPAQKNIDILLTISNDGWFLHSAELEQHLSSAVFRAVENRIAVARSVNTGASAIIHPNGKIHTRVVLSEEKIARLAPLSAALAKLADIAEKMAVQIENPTALTTLRLDFNRLRSTDLHLALGALGQEFSFMENRLATLASLCLSGDLPTRRRAVQDLVDQVADDLRTVDRWKQRPWTAPAYTSAVVKCDSRLTLYTRWGDWLALGALALLGMMLLDWLLRRLRRRFVAVKSKEAEKE